MEKLIEEINRRGYRVSLHQYESGRWDAHALIERNGGATYPHQVAFASTAIDALKGLIENLDKDIRLGRLYKDGVAPNAWKPEPSTEDDFSDLA